MSILSTIYVYLVLLRSLIEKQKKQALSRSQPRSQTFGNRVPVSGQIRLQVESLQKLNFLVRWRHYKTGSLVFLRGESLKDAISFNRKYFGLFSIMVGRRSCKERHVLGSFTGFGEP